MQASSTSLLPVTEEERLETISQFSLPSVTTDEALESISQFSLPSVTTDEALESISQLSLPSVTTVSQLSEISRLQLSDTSSVMSTRSTTSTGTTSRFRRFSIPEKTSLLEMCGKSQETHGGRLNMSEILSSWLTKHPDVQITPDQLRNKVKKMTTAIKALKNIH